MMPRRRVVWLSIWAVAAAGCREESSREALAALLGSPTAAARAERLERALAATQPDSSAVLGDRDALLANWVLPPSLQEISGLALTSDGRLFVHDDELGQVWEIDYRRGILVKRFVLGPRTVKADFEGLTVARDSLYMLTSNGDLYAFREGRNDARVRYTKRETGLKRECEFEGVAYDASIDALLLACKRVYAKNDDDALVIFRYGLRAGGKPPITRLEVRVPSGTRVHGRKELHPSDITVDPVTGNYVMVAAQEKALISVTPAGSLAFVRPLPTSNQQPEGVAITRDGILLVSDEAGPFSGAARITLTRWR